MPLVANHMAQLCGALVCHKIMLAWVVELWPAKRTQVIRGSFQRHLWNDKHMYWLGLFKPVRAQSLLEAAACSASPLHSNVLFDDARRCYTELCISSLGSVCFRERIFTRSHYCSILYIQNRGLSECGFNAESLLSKMLSIGYTRPDTITLRFQVSMGLLMDLFASGRENRQQAI